VLGRRCGRSAEDADPGHTLISAHGAKASDELKEQIEKQAEENPPAVPDNQRTAEGLEVPTPTPEGFLGNLEKVSKSGK
jgi:hypothetical protein